ncbi:hypothetical protein [Maricaulis sp.]|uniref:hypothetical protein n=1 Tax=Maricaulis sp. TaxID=1486257 RepID=UPI003A94533A
MTQELEVLDEGHKGWLSWIVARDHSTRSSRHRLDSLLPRMALLGEAACGRPIGKGWQEISRKAAELRAHNFAKSGIAYAPSRARLREGLVERKARLFFEHFAEDARAFTNCSLVANLEGQQTVVGWDPISASTFDMAFGLTGEQVTGIFCIEDED